MFESFCESISASVENKIYRCFRINAISAIQAARLIRHGYILGGWYISPSLIGSLGLIPFVFMQYTGRIDNNLRLNRDASLLSEYYHKYKSRYDACTDGRDLDRLFTEIEQDLFNYSIEIINNTCEFGG